MSRQKPATSRIWGQSTLIRKSLSFTESRCDCISFSLFFNVYTYIPSNKNNIKGITTNRESTIGKAVQSSALLLHP